MKDDHFFLSPDDPRLTAYALGELDPADHARVDAAVRSDAALQAAVNEIRSLGLELTAALANEPVPSTTASFEPIPMPAFAEPGQNGKSPHKPAKRSKLLQFPSLYYVVAGGAAAAFAIVVATYPISPRAPRVATKPVEISFVPMLPTRENAPDDIRDFTVAPAPPIVSYRSAVNEAAYAQIRDAFLRVMDKPFSTLSIDVGRSSYADVRRFLNGFRLPPPAAVRIEELVNYFPYQYAPPPVAPASEQEVAPFAAHLEVASAPWAPTHRLVRIGLKGRELSKEEREHTDAGSSIIAKGVSFEVEFNPAQVAQYRLLGYEDLPKSGDLKPITAGDGDIRAGYSLTALYEIIPAGSEIPADGGNPTRSIKYTSTDIEPGRARPAFSKEMLTLTLRFKQPAGDVSQRLEFPLVDNGGDFDAASPDFQFAAAVASFGMLLRESPHRGLSSLTDVGRWAQLGSAKDPGGYRSEFLGLVRQAEQIRR